MRIKVLFLAFLSFFISSCADVSVSKKEAIDKFITKAESETKLYDAIKEEPAPKKQLIKFIILFLKKKNKTNLYSIKRIK